MGKTTEIIKVTDLSSNLYHYLYQLNFRGGSHMQYRFSDARKDIKDGYVVICRKYRKEIMGWCLVWRDKKDTGPWTVYFYVKKTYRRQGVGTLLAETAYKFCKDEIKVWWHDDASGHFFGHVENTVAVKYL